MNPTAKAVCIARNYAAHAEELGHQAPQKPIFFIKPASAMRPFALPIRWPTNQGACHFELELACFMGKKLVQAGRQEAKEGIGGYGLALDLTLRDLQKRLQQAGRPWEMAKAWDGSLPLSPSLPFKDLPEAEDCLLELEINGETRQKERTSRMITPIFDLIAQASHWFTLNPGDIVLTGTPAGVGPLAPGDQITARLAGQWEFKTQVADS